jgi:hypothetical protein
MRSILRILSLFAVSFAAFGQDPLPDFHLKDVSYTSPRRNTLVSPRDYLRQVSAYYFTDAI